jgi:hypothetical protein
MVACRQLDVFLRDLEQALIQLNQRFLPASEPANPLSF